MYTKRNIQINNSSSERLYKLISATEKKSALDYTYWETKILHQTNNENTKADFERNFITHFVVTIWLPKLC